MPMPLEYRRASEDWRRFLDIARERTLIESDNVIYTALEGLFLAFRIRITPSQVLLFADQLPAVMRAILVHRWDLSQ